MDNSNGSVFEKTVNSEEIKPQEVKQEEVKSQEVTQNVEEVKKPEIKQVPIHELYKERNRRKNLENEVSMLRAEQAEIRQSLHKMKSSQEDDDLVIEAEKELGIDREAARKLLNLQKKVVERSSPRQSSQNLTDPALVAMDEFKRRAYDSSQNYEDWNEMIPSMQAIMAKEIEQNGLGAYGKSPDYYYSKAVRAQMESKARAKKEDSVDRENNISTSITETGGSGNKTTSPGITQAIFDANRKDPKWVKANADEIKDAWKKGKLK